MNNTTKLIISRLPKKPLLSQRDISDAIGLCTTSLITRACESGDIEHLRAGWKYIISREEAIRWIIRLEK